MTGPVICKLIISHAHHYLHDEDHAGYRLQTADIPLKRLLIKGSGCVTAGSTCSTPGSLIPACIFPQKEKSSLAAALFSYIDAAENCLRYVPYIVTRIKSCNMIDLNIRISDTHLQENGLFRGITVHLQSFVHILGIILTDGLRH